METVRAPALKDHTLERSRDSGLVRYERRPLLDRAGRPVEGLAVAWIVLDNPAQLNSYTTEMVKDVILAFRRASMDRGAVAVVFTAAGDRAFSTGGNTREYAEYYAGRPLEYRQYMRLFNDMVTSILTCDKPVINRVNGMRIGGGQEIGMACDFSIAADTARFGQAGPKHGSAPDGGSTDFLHLFTGIGFAMESCVLCEPISAHKALRLGLVNRIVPVLRLDGRFIANPLVITDRIVDEFGRPCLGEPLEEGAKSRGKELLARATVDLSLLDAEVERFCTLLSETMPECTSKTLESLRKKKLEHWQQNCESNRAWLALNMMTEGKAGFRAFEAGRNGRREVDFHALRRALAAGRPFDDALIEEISPHGEEEEMSIAAQRTGRTVASTTHAEGAVVRIAIDAPKGNILSREVIALLHDELGRAQADPGVGLVTLEGVGANFSYGASVAEHLPEEIEETLPALHRLVLGIAASPVPVASLVRGRCLGGALEVAAAGHFVFAAPDARFALPEIRLGVFPAGCSLLPMRLGQTLCDRMVITGEELDAAALRPSGFITAIFPSDELFAHALDWHRRWIAPSSVASLRMATVASRHGFLERLRRDLHALEEAYLRNLVPTEDASEGIQAFLAKRDPVWRNR